MQMRVSSTDRLRRRGTKIWRRREEVQRKMHEMEQIQRKIGSGLHWRRRLALVKLFNFRVAFESLLKTFANYRPNVPFFEQFSCIRPYHVSIAVCWLGKFEFRQDCLFVCRQFECGVVCVFVERFCVSISQCACVIVHINASNVYMKNIHYLFDLYSFVK